VKRLKGFIFQFPVGMAVSAILVAVGFLIWGSSPWGIPVAGGFFGVAAGSILFALRRIFWP